MDVAIALPSTRKRRVQREHILQRYVTEFSETAIDSPVENYHFFSFDTARKATENERAREASRGIRRDTLDTLLIMRGRVDTWVELKVAPNVLSAGQARMINKLIHMGKNAEVAWSIADVCRIWRFNAIPLVPNADYIALHLDGKVATGIAKTEQRAEKPGRAPRTQPRFVAGKRLARRMNIDRLG